jgi:hypothetical protein
VSVQVRTLTAPDLRELERLVQFAVAQGWQRVGAPAEMTYNGTMKRTKWQQGMWRKP